MRNSGDLRTRILNKRQIRSICREEILVSRQADVSPLPSVLTPPDAILVPYSQPSTQDDSEQSNSSGDGNAWDIHRPISHRDDDPLEPAGTHLGRAEGFKGSREPARTSS